jgi:aldehyde dehydrogenase (NAD+)
MSELAAQSSSTPGSKVNAELKAAFRGGRTRSLRWRQDQLSALVRLIEENLERLTDSLVADLGKPRLEAFSTELGYVMGEARFARKHLKKWMKPERVPTSAVVMPGTSRIIREPLGVSLIIGAWNYPVHLTLAPLIGSIAAGGCAVVKPSEVAAHTSKILAELIPRYLDQQCIQVVEGGVPETTDLLEQQWDKIFYTGNGNVGRIVMAAAARHLTPVTLELGGKSPTIVDADVDLKVAARRIIWCKFTNAGQTCVAPDHVLVHSDQHDALVNAMRRTIHEFYGSDPKQSADYGRIINHRHFDRLVGLLGSGHAACGGDHDRDEKYIAPTILTDVSPDSPAMSDEIFGPILPILKMPSTDDAIEFVNSRPKPLALYVFSRNKAVARRVIEHTSSGGATINHGWMHLGVPSLPFGGVGDSGIGGYHGRHSFEAFSHRKAVLDKPTLVDPKLLYPPYGKMAKALFKRLL